MQLRHAGHDHGKGPYLFVVDPNVQGMAVNATVVHDAWLETGDWNYVIKQRKEMR